MVQVWKIGNVFVEYDPDDERSLKLTQIEEIYDGVGEIVDRVCAKDMMYIDSTDFWVPLCEVISAISKWDALSELKEAAENFLRKYKH